MSSLNVSRYGKDMMMGSSIEIGAFKDEYCSKPIENDISMYLENGIKLDNTILDMVAETRVLVCPVFKRTKK